MHYICQILIETPHSLATIFASMHLHALPSAIQKLLIISCVYSYCLANPW